MVIAYAVQLSWHPKVIEVKPFLQTVSAESTGPHAEVRPNPVTGIKKREYEIGNECVPREPDIPCLMANHYYVIVFAMRSIVKSYVK